MQVLASGVCHSDLSTVNGYVPLPPPSILGHEGAGVVMGWAPRSRASGPATTHRLVHPRLRPVLLLPPRPDNLCEQMWSFWWCRAHPTGRQRRHGHDGPGHVLRRDDDRRAVGREGGHRPPAEQLALIGCGVTTGVGAALNTAQVEPGSIVAVVGCGGVGLPYPGRADRRRAARIIAVDPVELKRKTAEQLGATDLVDPSQGDPVAQVQALTSGRAPTTPSR